MNDPWLEQELAAFREEAREECARCQGREHGDCSFQCRYFLETASEAELEEFKRQGATFVPGKSRLWGGPRGTERIHPAGGRD